MKTSLNPAQVRRLRNQCKLNQSDFWSRFGVTQSGGSRYESGRTIPRPPRR
jgi:DNA-binding transcriptional regulator YiaG